MCQPYARSVPEPLRNCRSLLYRARESLEPVTAGVREAEALEVAEGAPLMLVERTAYARSGEPVEYARDLFRGDRTRVVVWTSELAGDI